MGRALAPLFTIMLCLVMAATARAHKPSDSYLTLAATGDGIDGRWDIALRDLDHAMGLDGNDDGQITWGEVRTRENAIAAYALARLTLSSGGVPCPAQPRGLMIERHSDGAYAVLRFTAPCAKGSHAFEIGYRLFFDLDPQHRGLLKVQSGGTATSAVFAPDRTTFTLSLERPEPFAQAAVFFGEGVRHILDGIDHLLFLISLLLPAVLRAEGGRWRPVDRPAEAILDVVKVVTAFTLAHSITLALATFDLISLPPRIVEPLIAASIVLAALNNVYPLVTRGLWAVAFGFGLIHGIGFADGLRDLGLPPGAMLLALVSFNLGVEAGQLAVVALVLPAIVLVRHLPVYRRVGLPVGSLAIAAVAGLWFVERAFGLVLVI
jgi:hypothetical protein